MKPYRKPFSHNLYGKYDGIAKETLIKLLEAKGHVVINSKESYTADLVTQKDGKTYFNEAEVKVSWKGDWPTHWKEIRIPERKKKLLSKYTSNLTFYIFREDLKQVWCIDSKQLKEDTLKEAKGRNIMKGEQFYHVPYVDAKLINIKETA
ncbi:MAG: hypothetical protein CBC83_02285 [Flavobacteriales bacterium TMED123]|nr:hypothetical protein [Candidatus Neomarinimicrobiota bacterium]MAJ44510.1 hypothetical protein [Candidatus Neomarinimicrobiota bacterium]OUV73946.1 MAG: hypothetical protein CBC83_04730 [Flavobacteriales bacterium TMED123]OUV75587.1 MAG: hypothetical protein CBC83_02285 [Flavobacteriales bacterium TMED123]|tara:strand:+ start:2172 stop:2621 length:450 start_codon:yes stop_codon:yes gene_type:complete